VTDGREIHGVTARLSSDARSLSNDARSLSALIAGDAIRVGVVAADWRAAVRSCGDALVASGATEPAYTDEMIAVVERLGPYLVLAPGIALAHARPSPAVHRAGMSVVTLASPVEFGHPANDPVRLVVGLAALDDEGHLEGLATIAEFLADPGRRAALLAAPDADAVRHLLTTYEEGR
jgi:PTS system ascorbate-specific IIA component